MNSNQNQVISNGLTFDDVLLSPKYSEVLPSETKLDTHLTEKLKLKVPLLSAAMDTVTEAKTAIVMSQEGGMGVIHKNLSIESQAYEVKTVKKSETVIISDPITIQSESSVQSAFELMKKNNISGLPVVDHGVLVGIVTGRDIRFEKNIQRPVSQIMTKKVITIEKNGSLCDAVGIMHKHRIEKLPVLSLDKKTLVGMYTIKDIEKASLHPNAAKDSLGRLVVGAAIGVTANFLERCEALLANGCDLIVVDTAHGFSKGVIEGIKNIKNTFSRRYDFDLMGGNVATADATHALIDAGCDIIKVGIGPGSICTTRIIAGVGIPQLTAILECVRPAKKAGVTIIADGGIRFSGDIVKALAAGANAVMIGSLFAGTDEAPGEHIIYQGKNYKVYRGMGSISAMAEGAKDRYFQSHVKATDKFVPEGIEGKVPYKGDLASAFYQLAGGLRSGMGYLGASNLAALRENAEFVKISPASLRESHAHDIHITRGAPNYQVE